MIKNLYFKKLTFFISFILFALCSFSLNVYAQTQDELKTEILTKITAYKANIQNKTYSVAILNEAKSLRDKINTLEDYSTKKSFIIQVDDIISQMKLAIYDGEEVLDYNAIQSNIKFTMSDGSITLYLPKSNNLHYYTVSVKDLKYNIDIINYTKDKNIRGGSFYLPQITEKLQISYDIKLYDNTNTVKATRAGNLEFNDTTAPKVVCAYVVNEKLKILAEDDYKMSSRSYYYEVNDKSVSDYTSNYLELNDIPAKVLVKVKDTFGNITQFTLNIDTDNKVYYGTATTSIQDELDDAKISDYKAVTDVKNIVIGEYGKQLELTNAFYNYFKEVFGSDYSEKYLKITQHDISVDTYNKRAILDKIGLYKIEVYSENTNRYANVYVAVGKNKNISSNIKEIKTKLPYDMTNNSLDLKNLLSFTCSTSNANDLNKSFVIIKNGNNIFRTDDTINFSDSGIYDFDIIDLGSSIRIKHSLRYTKPTTNTTIYFKDIENRWFKSSVEKLASYGIIKGYEDNLFKPYNNITIREFLLFLNRTTLNEERENLNNFDISISRYDTDYHEIKNVLSKLTPDDLIRSGFVGRYDQPITREEVAFLISKYYTVIPKQATKQYNDMYQSKYYAEMQLMVAHNVFSGYSDNTIRPLNNITRAETAAILARLKK